MKVTIIKKLPVISVGVLFSLYFILLYGMSGVGVTVPLSFLDVYETFTLVVMVIGISALAAVTFLLKRKRRVLLLMQSLIFTFLFSLNLLFQFCLDNLFSEYIDFIDVLIVIGTGILLCVIIGSIKFLYSSSWGRLDK